MLGFGGIIVWFTTSFQRYGVSYNYIIIYSSKYLRRYAYSWITNTLHLWGSTPTSKQAFTLCHGGCTATVEQSNTLCQRGCTSESGKSYHLHSLIETLFFTSFTSNSSWAYFAEFFLAYETASHFFYFKPRARAIRTNKVAILTADMEFKEGWRSSINPLLVIANRTFNLGATYFYKCL